MYIIQLNKDFMVSCGSIDECQQLIVRYEAMKNIGKFAEYDNQSFYNIYKEGKVRKCVIRQISISNCA